MGLLGIGPPSSAKVGDGVRGGWWELRAFRAQR